MLIFFITKLYFRSSNIRLQQQNHTSTALYVPLPVCRWFQSTLHTILGMRVKKCTCLPQFWHLQQTSQKFKPHILFGDFRADKTFTTHWSGYRIQVWVQVLAPACPIIWQLLLKAIPKDNNTVWLPSQRARSSRSILAQLRPSIAVQSSYTAYNLLKLCSALAHLKSATTFMILTEFECQKDFNALKFLGSVKKYSWEMAQWNFNGFH